MREHLEVLVRPVDLVLGATAQLDNILLCVLQLLLLFHSSAKAIRELHKHPDRQATHRILGETEFASCSFLPSQARRWPLSSSPFWSE